jgi:hypothetical protein
MENIRKYQKNGDWKQMLEYYTKNKETMKNENINISLITFIETFTSISKTHRKSIFDIVGSIKKDTIPECSFNLLIRLYTLFNSKENIIELLRMMESKNIPIKKRTISPLITYSLNNNYLDFMNNLCVLFRQYEIVLDDNDYIKLLKFYGEKGDQEIFNLLFRTLINQLDIISYDLANTIIYYYSFRVVTSTITINFNCKKCNTSLVRDKLSIVERKSILKLITDNLANGNPKFLDYIKELEHNPKRFETDYILDGANIGFFQQRPDLGGKLSYTNINKIITYLKQQNKSVILFLHENHLNPKNISNYNQKIIKEWEDSEVLYKTKRGLNDDWYWLYLGVYLEHSQIISNDKMCDHYFNCCHEKSFKRWRDITQIEFNFSNNKVNLGNSKIADNGALENELKIHIPYYKNKNKIEWLCIDN